MKVTVIGASGGIGQPLSLLLTQNTTLPINELALFDLRLSKGVSTDLSHMTGPTTGIDAISPKKVKGYGKDELSGALENADIVVIVAGIPRKPGMTRDDLFKINGGIMRNLILETMKHARPDCLVAIISNPVNSLVPLAVETMKQDIHQKYAPEKRVFGVTTLDLVRAITFLKESGQENVTQNGNSSNCNNNSNSNSSSKEDIFKDIVVIGGHSGKTILPIIPESTLLKKGLAKGTNTKDYNDFVYKVQFAGDEVVKAKEGMGSATLSMAYSGYMFVSDLINARCNTQNKQAYTSSTTGMSNTIVAYVCLNNNNKGQQLKEKLHNSVDYFSTPVVLQKNTGFVEHLDFDHTLNKLNTHELQLLNKDVLPQLAKDINKGESFVRSSKL
ncbi:hypothetical protein ACO0RG_001328 [Hanseniaspora osmophila]|uniref:Malate dehydrogenase n=1 Tax=Hanseniaspora osmophila TaxID=56408 RepID=A0A1E5RNM3_9ASCO|nr:Malate dehydrogenase, peroxisomal [Hanseniaspora osmophila]